MWIETNCAFNERKVFDNLTQDRLENECSVQAEGNEICKSKTTKVKSGVNKRVERSE
jgi:hypothetical protein